MAAAGGVVMRSARVRHRARHGRVRPFVALALTPLFATAQGGELQGRVVDNLGRPVPGARVTLTAVGFSVTTDSLGAFRLTGTAGGTLALTVSAPGFRTDTGSVQLVRDRPGVREFVLLPDDAPFPEGAASSGEVLRGQVMDGGGVPVSWANVQVNGGRRILADQEGRFTIPLAANKPFSLLVRRIGYEPGLLRFAARPDTAIQVHLSALASLLPEQHVTGRAAFASLDLNGFYRRMGDVERGITHGYFVTPEELDLRKPGNVTDAVEAVPTVRIRPIPGSKFPLARNLRIEDRMGCPMTVFLDRVRVQPFLSTSERKFIDTGINELIHPHAVAGIEVYPRAMGAPPEFQANNGTCGVVLLWTK